MKRDDFLRLLEDKLEADPGSLSGGVQLRDVPVWDSLAVITFIVLADQHCKAALTGADLRGCRTVDDLMGLLGPGLED